MGETGINDIENQRYLKLELGQESDPPEKDPNTDTDTVIKWKNKYPEPVWWEELEELSPSKRIQHEWLKKNVFWYMSWFMGGVKRYIDGTNFEEPADNFPVSS